MALMLNASKSMSLLTLNPHRATRTTAPRNRRPGLVTVVLTTLVLSLLSSPPRSQAAEAGALSPTPKEENPLASPPSPRIQKIVNETAAAVLQEFQPKQLLTNELALTLVDLKNPAKPEWASYRGAEGIYPASVIKLFYLVAAHRWMEDRKLEDTAELRRAMRDMIVESYNEATHYIIDLLTGTTSGPELPPEEIKAWFEKRNAVNRYFLTLGYTNIVANKKPWCEGPYGRESQAIKAFKPNRNMLTTDATARLLTEIVLGRAVSPERCRQMLELMARDLAKASEDPDDQVKFTGPVIPPGSRIWSKAGWTSDTRHDATYIELPDGGRFVLVTYTLNHANEREILRSVARRVIANLRATTP